MRIDKTTIVIWICILAPLLISLSVAKLDINKQIDIQATKDEIDPLLTQASYYDNLDQFEKSIEEYNKILDMISYEDFPYEYATIQQKIGDSYRNLAELKDNETNLENAINAYKEALKIFTIEKYPIDYAFTNINIGDSYRDLAKLQETNMKKSDYNFKSYSAYGESLMIITSDNYPDMYSYVIENRQNVLQVTYRVTRDDPANFGAFSTVLITL